MISSIKRVVHMSWLKQILDFIHDNIDIIKANPWIFLTFLLLCSGLCVIIISVHGKRSKKRLIH